MGVSSSARAGERSTPRRMRTMEELLEREERRAWAGLMRSAGGVGEDLVRATRLRERVRAAPVLSLGLAAAAGFLAAPCSRVLLRRGLPLLLGGARGSERGGDRDPARRDALGLAVRALAHGVARAARER